MCDFGVGVRKYHQIGRPLEVLDYLVSLVILIATVPDHVVFWITKILCFRRFVRPKQESFVAEHMKKTASYPLFLFFFS